MRNRIFYLRNHIIGLVYRNIVKQILFKFDPETVHDRMINLGKFLGSFYITRLLIRLIYYYSNNKLEQTILGVKFSNPIGLSAGFDKDAVLTDILPCVGFGFEEVGSITGEPCEGNPKPRLWRLKKSKSLVVYYGLKNEGCEKISRRLKNKSFKIPIGISIAKTNNPKTIETNAGINDYVKAFNKFTDIGSYFTINISCPNAFGGQPFTDAKKLDKLLIQIDKIHTKKPIFLKISPDLNNENIDAIIKVASQHNIHGFICANLTKKRDNKRIIDDVPEKGGMSGKVVEDLSNKLIKYVYSKTKGKFIIIGCGGVFSAKDAYKKIKLGASLVQLITGMIFEGPQLISNINLDLVKLLEKDGFNNISEAIGINSK